MAIQLLCDGAKKAWANSPYTIGKFVSAWQTAAEQWSKKNVPFHLVFVF